MYSAGDKAMATVMPSYQPLTKARREAIEARVESKFKEAVIDYAFDPIMIPGRFGQVTVCSLEDKALEMMTEAEFVQTFERLFESFQEAANSLAKALGGL